MVESGTVLVVATIAEDDDELTNAITGAIELFTTVLVVFP